MSRLRKSNVSVSAVGAANYHVRSQDQYLFPVQIVDWKDQRFYDGALQRSLARCSKNEALKLVEKLNASQAFAIFVDMHFR